MRHDDTPTRSRDERATTTCAHSHHGAAAVRTCTLVVMALPVSSRQWMMRARLWEASRHRAKRPSVSRSNGTCRSLNRGFGGEESGRAGRLLQHERGEEIDGGIGGQGERKGNTVHALFLEMSTQCFHCLDASECDRQPPYAFLALCVVVAFSACTLINLLKPLPLSLSRPRTHTSDVPRSSICSTLPGPSWASFMTAASLQMPAPAVCTSDARRSGESS